MSAINESPASPTGGIPPDERRLLEQAIQWRTRIENGVATTHDAAYVAWLSDPRNRQAMNEVQAAWAAVADHAQAPRITKLRRWALADARGQRRRDRVAAWPVRVIAAAMTLALGIGLAAYIVIPRTDTYATAIGERRMITLADRSSLSLDADTKVLVRYSGNARKLTLQRGRARFDVAHDSVRPFTVTVGNETVTAVGTNFSVERLESKTVVMLLQGRVIVAAAESARRRSTNGSPRTVSLRAGQKLVLNHTGLSRVGTFSPQEATAWESGRLQFFDEPLSEAVAHVNRYTTTPIEVDPSAADIKVSGVFVVGDVASFVEGVTNYLPVEAASIGGRTVLRGKSRE